MNPHLHELPPFGGVIRQLRPSDFDRFRAHLLRLGAPARRDRFNGAANDHFLVDYAHRCFSTGATVVGYIVDGEVRGAAELHERPGLPLPTGEIAFSVEEQMQNRGLGGMLFRRILAHARALGYERLLVTTHPGNLAMRRLAQKFDARLTFEQGETLGLIERPPASAREPWERPPETRAGRAGTGVR